MQVFLESLEGLKRKMTVRIPLNSIHSAMQKRLITIQNTAKFDGFRVGKAPISLIKQKFGKQVSEEIKTKLIHSSYVEAIDKEAVKPVGAPEIEVIEEKDSEDFAYTATFEIFPELSSIELESIEIERPIVDVTAEDVDKMIENLRKKHRQWREIKRASQDGDMLEINIKHIDDTGESVEDSSENIEVEIGSGRSTVELENALIGMSKGDHKRVELPGQSHSEKETDKNTVFELKVNKVSEAEMPKLDKVFFKLFNEKNNDLDSFKKYIKKNMQLQLADEIKIKLKHRLIDALLDKNEVSAPQAMVRDEINSLRIQVAESMGQDPKKIDLDKFPEKMFFDQAVKRVKTAILMRLVIDAEHLELDASYIDATLKKMAQRYDEPQQFIDFYTQNEKANSRLKNIVMEDQVIEHIFQKIKITDKQADFDDIMNNVHPMS